MNDNELAHVGVLGMKWGRRRAQSAARASGRDAADLRKHGYKKEAAAVQKVSDSQRKKAEEYGRRIGAAKKTKMIDTKPREWSTGKKVLVAAIVAIGTLKLVDVAAGTTYNIAKIAMGAK